MYVPRILQTFFSGSFNTMSNSNAKSYELTNQVDDDFNIDDIEDAPAFVILPTGTYVVNLATGIQDKLINGNEYFSIEMTVVSCVEVAQSALLDGETLPREGDTATLIFGKTNMYGMSNFKAFIKPIATKFNITKVRDIKEYADGMTIMVVVKRTFDKKRERYNMNVTQTAVV